VISTLTFYLKGSGGGQRAVAASEPLRYRKLRDAAERNRSCANSPVNLWSLRHKLLRSRRLEAPSRFVEDAELVINKSELLPQLDRTTC